MFGPYRRFPFRGLALVALGFLLASAFAGSAASGAAAGFGLLFALPLLMFKMFLMFMFFGALFRFAGGGWGRGRDWGHHHGPRYPHPGGPRPEKRDPVAESERRDWEESLRQAREEVRKFDTSTFPPRGPFEPPTDAPEEPRNAAPSQDA